MKPPHGVAAKGSVRIRQSKVGSMRGNSMNIEEGGLECSR